MRFLAFLSVALLACGCGSDPGGGAKTPEGKAGAAGNAPAADARPELRKVTLGLNWKPEMEHGGFYAALVHGFYKDAGLDVTIEPGGVSAPVGQQVDSGKFEFGVENADRILSLRAAGVKVVGLMAPLQSSPRCIMVHADSPITSFENLRDVTLAMKDGAPWAEFLKKKINLAEKNVRVVGNPNVALFLTDKNYAQQAYVFSEPIVVEERGGKARSLMVSDLGFNPYTSVLICSDALLDKDPELVRKFVEASVKGWKTYLEDPSESHQRIHELNPEMTPSILAAGDEAMKPLCRGDDENFAGLGRMTAERWRTLADQMVEVGAIDEGAVDPASAFRTEFLSAEAP